MQNIAFMKSYNNCFTLGCKSKTDDGSYTKIAGYIDRNGKAWPLWGGKDGELRHYYELTYEQAKETLDAYMQGSNLPKGAETLRVSLYLDKAKFGSLHMFVIDFDKLDDKIETESSFFKAAKDLADKVTRSQGGGYHMFYGVNKKSATPLFDSINLLASKSAKSFVSKTGAVSLDEKNKVDMFCDAHRFLYEWEERDNTIGLTDKTQELFELIKANFALTRPMDFNEWEDAEDGITTLEGMSESALMQEMTDKQQEIFCDLKTISSDCSREMWFSIGLDIYHVFGDELGGSVFLWWSKPGHSFNPQGCARTWAAICKCGPKTTLRNATWDSILAVSVF